MFDPHTEKLSVLTSSIEAREREVFMYQINIDNYRQALNIIEEKYCDRDDLLPFIQQLHALLESSLLEQTKEKIMLEVLQRQLNNLTPL